METKDLSLFVWKLIVRKLDVRSGPAVASFCVTILTTIQRVDYTLAF